MKLCYHFLIWFTGLGVFIYHWTSGHDHIGPQATSRTEADYIRGTQSRRDHRQECQYPCSCAQNGAFLTTEKAIHRCKSSTLPKYREIFERTRAVVFCGTPHRGSDAAAWGRLASNVVKMALQDVNSKILNDLQVDSEILDLIQDDFLKVLHESNISVHSFQEGEGLAGVRGFSGKVPEFSYGRMPFRTDEIV